MLGRANTRMKDYFDIWMLARSHDFKDDGMARGHCSDFRKARH